MREDVFAELARFAGVGCGAHTLYGTVCVIDYAGGYVDAGGGRR